MNYRQHYIIKNIMAWIAVCAFATFVNFGNCENLQELAFIQPMLKACSIFVSVSVIIWGGMLLIKREYMPSGILLAIISMYCYIALITLYNGNTPFRRIMTGILFMTIAFDIILYKKDTILFKNALNMLNILVLLNFVSILGLCQGKGFVYYDDEGIRRNGYYLLGYDNGHIIMILPVICFNLMLFMRTKKKRYLILPCLSVVGIFITFSATSIMLIVFMALFYGIYTFIPAIRKIICNKNVLLIALVSFFAFFILMHGYDYFADFFNYLFHKNVGGARGKLYQIGMDYIKENWLFGYGCLVKKTWINGYNSAHNIFLNLLLTGGIIGLLWFLVILYMTFDKGEKSLSEYRENLVLFSAVVAFVVADFTEGYDTYNTFYLFFCLCMALSNGSAIRELLDHYEDSKLSGRADSND